ncbi:16S rRNA (guanine(527)-N(7))-methyltransferase RsmG [Glaciecola siphonariae]|uniref:Ribosomal RNA small subunit methyltransferase G n=1 Tax=Glaciecola siphonariae TaxID=521012 RepID=A0ABV9LQJ5_9ALTE
MTEHLTSKLTKLIEQTSLSANQAQIDKLVGFVMLMDKWNKAYNLSSVREPEQMLVKHIMDSLVVAPYIHGNNIADVGTGPGLPGVPLAILFPEKSFTLIDSLGKRIRFIKQACYELDISNVCAIQERVENVTSEPAFDLVLSRAFASLSDMLNWCAHLVDNNGEFLALKGQLHQDELAQVPADFKIVNTVKISVPELTGERHIVSIHKQ